MQRMLEKPKMLLIAVTVVLVMIIGLLYTVEYLNRQEQMSSTTGPTGQDDSIEMPDGVPDSMSGSSDFENPEADGAGQGDSTEPSQTDTAMSDQYLGYAEEEFVTTYVFRDLIFDFPDSWSIGETPGGFIHAREGDDLESEGLPLLQISQGRTSLDHLPATEEKDRSRLSYLVTDVYTAEEDYDGPGGEPVTQSRVAYVEAAGNPYTVYYIYQGEPDEDYEEFFNTFLRSLIVNTGGE